MPVKVTFMFADQGFRWSEIHYNTQFFSPASASQSAFDLAKQRATLLGVGAFIREIRIGSVPANGLVEDVNFAGGLAGAFGTPGPSVFGSVWSAPPATVLLTRIQSALGLHRNYYISGAPAALFTGANNDGEFIKYNAVPEFYPLFSAYMGLLTSGAWGWLTRTSSALTQCTGLVQGVQTPPMIGLQTAAAVPGVTQGGQVLVRGWRRANLRGTPPFTGVQVVAQVVPPVAPATTWTYYLLNTSQITPTSFFTVGKIGPLQLTTVGYSAWTGLEAASRKRQSGPLGRRGRARIRG